MEKINRYVFGITSNDFFKSYKDIDLNYKNKKNKDKELSILQQKILLADKKRLLAIEVIFFPYFFFVQSLYFILDFCHSGKYAAPCPLPLLLQESS